jgi:hypothetical protein
MIQRLLKKAIGMYVAIAFAGYMAMGVAFRESVNPLIWVSALVATLTATSIGSLCVVVDKAVNLYRRKAKALERQLKVAQAGIDGGRDEIVRAMPVLLAIFGDCVRVPEGMKGDRARVYFSCWLAEQLQSPGNRLLAAIKELYAYQPGGDDLEWLYETFLPDASEERREAFRNRLMGICVEELFERPGASQRASDSVPVSD